MNAEEPVKKGAYTSKSRSSFIVLRYLHSRQVRHINGVISGARLENDG